MGMSMYGMYTQVMYAHIKYIKNMVLPGMELVHNGNNNFDTLVYSESI